MKDHIYLCGECYHLPMSVNDCHIWCSCPFLRCIATVCIASYNIKTLWLYEDNFDLFVLMILVLHTMDNLRWQGEYPNYSDTCAKTMEAYICSCRIFAPKYTFRFLNVLRNIKRALNIIHKLAKAKELCLYMLTFVVCIHKALNPRLEAILSRLG